MIKLSIQRAFRKIGIARSNKNVYSQKRVEKGGVFPKSKHP
jgi:hypothetical protein